MTEKNKKEKDNFIRTIDETIPKTVFKVTARQPKRTYILFLKGQLLGKLFSLKKGTTILGRSASADITINDSSVSREHLKIKVTGEKAVIEDLGSTNGTYINRKRISKHSLQDGDKIQISPLTVFKFLLSDESEKIFHEELYRMGVMDPVTNVYNKRYFMDRLKQEFSQTKRYKTDLSILMIDIDLFKKINDTYGHLAGDFVLGKLSEILSSMIRHEDIIARYGGEEFVAILAGTGEKGAMICAERIRNKIAEKPLLFEGKKINITVSIGVATLNEKNPFKTEEEFIEAADSCLYYSKKNGRNRTTCLSKIKA